MPSIRHDLSIHAPADAVWSAVRDFGAVHERLAPGFVVDARIDGDARVVTFANGSVARERLVDCDDAARRLVYAISSERVSHYNASVQVLDAGEAGSSRIVWTIDFLPKEIAPYIAAQSTEGARVMKQTLERGST